MKYLYRLFLFFARFDLAIAEAAPVRNMQRITRCREQVYYWQMEYDKECVQ